jgi:DNA-binding beta-propeller fold protein YncE
MPRHSRTGLHACAVVAVVAALTACAGTPAASPPHSTPAPSVATAQPTPTPTARPAISLADCPAAVDAGALHVVHHFDVSPDDVVVDATGRVWVTARQANLLFTLNADGSGVQSSAVAGGPEGVAVDGARVLVALQDLNAIAVAAPARSTLLTFPNQTANAGIDGIATDAAGGRLLVPDSPTGQLFAVPLSGAPVPKLLASNLGRPVMAAVDAAGNIFVANESSPGLVMITPSGSRRTVGRFNNLDEVVAYGGLLYVTDLNRRDVVAVNPATGAAVPIAVNLPAPQGLAITASGTLEIVDATTNTLYALPACGAGR